MSYISYKIYSVPAYRTARVHKRRNLSNAQVNFKVYFNDRLEKLISISSSLPILLHTSTAAFIGSMSSAFCQMLYGDGIFIFAVHCSGFQLRLMHIYSESAGPSNHVNVENFKKMAFF